MLNKLIATILFCVTLMLSVGFSSAQSNDTSSPTIIPASRSQEQKQSADRSLTTTLDSKVENKKDFLWKISSPKGQVYLLGSLHMVPTNFPPLNKEIEQAFQDSDNLVVEVDESTAAPGQVEQLTKQKGLYAENDSLSRHISKETKALLDKYLANTGITPSVFDVFKPWLAGLTISVTELQRQGFDIQAGLDKHFLQEAKASNKKIQELESVDFQINLLSGFSDELQDKLLLQSLLEIQDIQNEAAKMIEAWLTGDAQKMNEVVTAELGEHPDLKPVYDKLYAERNVNMEKKIEEYIDKGGSFFVVVGAGHLVGKEGLVQLLQDKGYKPEQLTSSLK